MAMDGQRNGTDENITCHPTRYNSPIKIMPTQSDTRQIISSHTVATTARIHRSASATDLAFKAGLRPPVAERPVRRPEQVPVSHGHRTPVSLHHAWSGSRRRRKRRDRFRPSCPAGPGSRVNRFGRCAHCVDRHLSVCDGAAGSCTVTQSPPAARGVRARVPSCAWAMLLTIARPRPTPAWSVRMRREPR